MQDDAAQPGRGQLGRAEVAVTGGPSPRGGRWIAACVRRRGTGRARALSLRSTAEKGRRGDAQKHPTHRAADGWERTGANRG